VNERRRTRLADFLAREWAQLVATVRARLADAADRDAEDIVQDVALGLFEQGDVGAPVMDLSAYVYRSLRNRIVDEYRSRRATVSLDAPRADEAPPLAEALPDRRPDVVTRLVAADDAERLHAALDRLPPDQRSVLLATEWEGRRFADLAAEWNVPLGTLLNRKHRAINRLRELMEGKDELS
jgi:RNA polymerase sigma factor (sigma-70 family)